MSYTPDNERFSDFHLDYIENILSVINSRLNSNTYSEEYEKVLWDMKTSLEKIKHHIKKDL